ncbi:MAG TPA: ABC transporter ATP-binding protein [Acidimicrobiales bacterium]|nr:ABC transporter ATP-binding protein [Acidimicrobiales bacterium]
MTKSNSRANALEVEGLIKSYGDRRVVDEVDLEIRAGEIFCLLGPNGAGKTTTVEILEGYRERDGGRVSVLGLDPGGRPLQLRTRVGIVLQTTGSFERLTVAETVAQFAGFYPNPLPTEEALSLVDLVESSDKLSGDLSGGQRRRLDVACGLVGRPELLFLDEPTTGLDPEARRRMWSVLEGLRTQGVTVLLTTHYMDEAAHLADRVSVLVQGRVVARGTPETLAPPEPILSVVELQLDSPDLSVAELSRLVGEEVVPDAEGWVRIPSEEPTGLILRLAEWVRSSGRSEVPGLAVQRPSLEDVYLALVEHHGRRIEVLS